MLPFYVVPFSMLHRDKCIVCAFVPMQQHHIHLVGSILVMLIMIHQHVLCRRTLQKAQAGAKEERLEEFRIPGSGEKIWVQRIILCALTFGGICLDSVYQILIEELIWWEWIITIITVYLDIRVLVFSLRVHINAPYNTQPE